jgi:hypothetical protein
LVGMEGYEWGGCDCEGSQTVALSAAEEAGVGGGEVEREGGLNGSMTERIPECAQKRASKFLPISTAGWLLKREVMRINHVPALWPKSRSPLLNFTANII